jgi:hypothetical protein
MLLPAGVGMDDLTSRVKHRLLGVGRRTGAGMALALGTAALGALGAIALPATAVAADITVRGQCFATGQTLTMSGTAFTPGGQIAISGDATGTAVADPLGVFRTEIVAPPVAGLGPRTIAVTATDVVNPANTTTLRMKVVRAAFGSNLPIAGGPREMTTWRFAGFAPAQPIYAHFILEGRSRGDYRFGVAKGDCGTLTVRAPRIPGVGAPQPGRWRLQLDQRMTYRDATPGSEVRFRIRQRAS